MLLCAFVHIFLFMTDVNLKYG